MLILLMIIAELVLGTVTIATQTCCRNLATDIAAVVITGFFVCEQVLKITACAPQPLTTSAHAASRACAW